MRDAHSAISVGVWKRFRCFFGHAPIRYYRGNKYLPMYSHTCPRCGVQTPVCDRCNKRHPWHTVYIHSAEGNRTVTNPEATKRAVAAIRERYGRP